jgi:hypothetical protein
MDEKLWAGVELKLQYAEFHFDMLGRSLQPPKQTSTNVALQASGAIIDSAWQRSFYAYLDALLSTARSVPEIIQCCFGVDRRPPEMKEWFKKLLVNGIDGRSSRSISNRTMMAFVRSPSAERDILASTGLVSLR